MALDSLSLWFGVTEAIERCQIWFRRLYSHASTMATVISSRDLHHNVDGFLVVKGVYLRWRSPHSP